jgi:hypothetical protein
MHTATMVRTYPAEINMDRDQLARCIDACHDCAQACTACADACLSEELVADLVKTIRTNLDCTDVCETTAAVLSRHTGYDANVSRAVLVACAQACNSCGAECDLHQEMEHCRICAETCHACERICLETIEAMA